MLPKESSIPGYETELGIDLNKNKKILFVGYLTNQKFIHKLGDWSYSKQLIRKLVDLKYELYSLF